MAAPRLPAVDDHPGNFYRLIDGQQHSDDELLRRGDLHRSVRGVSWHLHLDGFIRHDLDFVQLVCDNSRRRFDDLVGVPADQHRHRQHAQPGHRESPGCGRQSMAGVQFPQHLAQHRFAQRDADRHHRLVGMATFTNLPEDTAGTYSLVAHRSRECRSAASGTHRHLGQQFSQGLLH